MIGENCCSSVAAAAEYAEQEEEQVDEVEIEVHRADGCQFVGQRGVEVGGGHAFDLLGVPCGETNERSTPTIEMTHPSADECRNQFTIIAMNRPIRPMIRYVPIFDRSLLVQ